MTKFNAKMLAASALAAGLSLAASQALATAELQVTDGTTTITIPDESVLDGCAGVGCVSFSGSVGGWTFNIIAGFTKPVLGSGGRPELDVSFQDVYSGSGPNTLTILWSDVGFNTGPVTVSSEMGGTKSPGITSVSFADFADGSNALRGMASPLCGSTFTSSPFAGTCSGSFGGGSAYSLTQEVIITANGAGQTSGDHNTHIPEPATLGLLGIALAGLGFTLRRKRS